MTTALDRRSPHPAPPASTARLGISPIDPHRHTMAYGRLMEYLRIKVHHMVDERDWDQIVVIGRYDRSGVVSTKEKTDKLFNWQRPTTRVEGRTLVVECFPGQDYVHHYALIIATYLAMTGRYRGQVAYEPPTADVCARAASQLTGRFDDDHLVVLGWGLTRLCEEADWTPGHGHAWHRTDVEGRTVTYLGFQHSIWGEVAGRVVTRLADLGAHRVVYVGKVGTLLPDVTPNAWLATGRRSITSDSTVTWDDYFADTAAAHPRVLTGTHVCSPSILLEGQEWLARQDGHDFVDPEIGHMGAAASAAGIEFGYLHVISNNLAHHCAEDLSNERRGGVVAQRARLLRDIDDIIRTRVRHH